VLTLPPDPLNVGNLLPSSTKEYYRMRVNRTKRAVPFSDAFQVSGALFWDRRRPRLHTLPLAILSGDEGRRGRLRSQKSAPIELKWVTKGYRLLLSH